ncbi:MAG: hypothetical protein EA369_08495 [Bradymonadales bacterium]|nr:MAG: hypothetical protein EA369_08495 [Bradymonadales bacterium]
MLSPRWSGLFCSLLLLVICGAWAPPSQGGYQRPSESAEEDFWQAWNQFRASLSFDDDLVQDRAERLSRAYFHPDFRDLEAQELVSSLTEQLIEKMDQSFERLRPETQEMILSFLLDEFDRVWEEVERTEFREATRKKLGEAGWMAGSTMAGAYGVVGGAAIGYFTIRALLNVLDPLSRLIGRLANRFFPNLARIRDRHPASSDQTCQGAVSEVAENPNALRARLARWMGLKKSRLQYLRLSLALAAFAGLNYAAYKSLQSVAYEHWNWFFFLGDDPRPLKEHRDWHRNEILYRERLRDYLSDSLENLPENGPQGESSLILE